ncbi:glucose-6-phosphate 1-epimerase [Salmonella sp. NCTC 11881]|nr:glucose-6-phosphate 1-epimerase [Salmonella sp. NCTC 11881]
MINKIFALPVIEQLTPVLSRRQLDDLDLIVVDHPQVKASFCITGRAPSLLETRWRGRGIVAQ